MSNNYNPTSAVAMAQSFAVIRGDITATMVERAKAKAISYREVANRSNTAAAELANQAEELANQAAELANHVDTLASHANTNIASQSVIRDAQTKYDYTTSQRAIRDAQTKYDYTTYRRAIREAQTQSDQVQQRAQHAAKSAAEDEAKAAEAEAIAAKYDKPTTRLFSETNDTHNSTTTPLTEQLLASEIDNFHIVENDTQQQQSSPIASPALNGSISQLQRRKSDV